MNLNFIELLAILQRITSNSSDGNNIKQQAIKWKVKFSFFIRDSRNIFERPLSALNIMHCLTSSLPHFLTASLPHFLTSSLFLGSCPIWCPSGLCSGPSPLHPIHS